MEEVRRVFWAECVRPKEYVHEYDKYTTLVSRQAEEDVEQFLSEQHSFQEMMVEVVHYQQLADQIQYTSCKVPQQGGPKVTYNICILDSYVLNIWRDKRTICPNIFKIFMYER